MNKIKERLTGYTGEDFVKGIMIYAVAAFLICFMVLPLGTLFSKAFQDREGNFAGFSQFAEYFQSETMVYYVHISVGNTGVFFRLFAEQKKCSL